MAKKDFYRILNIPHKASLKDIKSAYRQLALKYHPDHNPDNESAKEMFNRIKEAYETLTHPDSRRRYDAQYKPQAPQEPAAKPEPPPEQTKTSKKGPVENKKKGKNLRYNLYITLEDVAFGCDRSIRYIRKNNGENETVQLKVKVPVGAFHQQRLKLVNYGDTDKSGTGDLFVIVHIQEHPMFIKKDLHLRVNVPVSYLDVMLGSSIEVPTLKGIRKLKLKACDFEHLEHRMKGHGLPDEKNQFNGDLTIYCFIENPTKLTTQEKNAAQKLLRTWPQGEMMRQYHSYLKQIKGK